MGGYQYLQISKIQKLEKRHNQNLRDHMTDWELILTMVGEKAANTESMFRIIQSIPSPKAEPFKR